MNLDEIKYSLRNLRTRKLRSFLSILSILIGIASIFAIVSFGAGIQNYVKVLAEEAGADKLYIQARGIGAPGVDENFFITADELDFIDKIKGVNELSGIYLKVAEIEHRKKKVFFFAAGVDMEKKEFIDEIFLGIKQEKGRQLKPGETDKVVLGHNYQIADKIFEKPIRTGDKIKINGESFDVLGFYAQVGNPHDDGNIYLTYEGFEALYPDTKDKFGYAMIKADRGVVPGELALKIEEKLRKFKDQDEGKEDFFVQSFEDTLETFGTIFIIINGVLVLIALVSLVVASVNIMNTMYTAVLERTQEIGIMKAIGAKNSEILSIFVFESAVLGFVGGVMGIFLGYVISSVGGAAAAAAGFTTLQPIFPLGLIIGSLVFATFVGAISGLLPAIQASKLQPVEALRYE